MWGTAYVLIRDDLDTLHMPCCLEYLLQNILGHAGVEATHVKTSFVWLRRGTSYTAGGSHATRAHGRGRRTMVLGNGEWRRHVAWHPILKARLTRGNTGGRRRREWSGGTAVDFHCCEVGRDERVKKVSMKSGWKEYGWRGLFQLR